VCSINAYFVSGTENNCDKMNVFNANYFTDKRLQERLNGVDDDDDDDVTYIK
jgi:hypothetical protein